MYGPDEQIQLTDDNRSQMVNQHHFERVVSLIQDALNQGATVVHGGIWDAGSRRIAPTVLDNVNMDMAIMKEEIFGPVLPVIRWEKDDEINAIVSQNPYPLAMYFFSKRNEAIQEWMRSNPAGTTGIEVVLRWKPQFALWGHPNQRHGKDRRLGGIQAILNMRSVLKQTSGSTSCHGPSLVHWAQPLARQDRNVGCEVLALPSFLMLVQTHFPGVVPFRYDQYLASEWFGSVMLYKMDLLCIERLWRRQHPDESGPPRTHCETARRCAAWNHGSP